MPSQAHLEPAECLAGRAAVLPGLRVKSGARTSYLGDSASPAAGEALEGWPARAPPWRWPASADATEALPGCLVDSRRSSTARVTGRQVEEERWPTTCKA